jgi:bifunctional DNA-binding transcriptional regulator/antitoxin component of YhaV-PrlF toxin-antitoxin module
MKKSHVIVAKKGRLTIPAWLRKKYKIKDQTCFRVIEKKDGILLKPMNSFWDMAGAFSDDATVEEVKKELDKLRHEDEDDQQPLTSV